MRILFLHNKYLISGGEDVSTQSEIDLLTKNGHQVDVLYLTNEDLARFSKVKLAVDTIWSRDSYQRVSGLLRNSKYDLVHVQNFMPQLSPSVFYAAHANKVKTVMSVRNYRLICPNALMFINNKICDACIGKTIPIPSISRKCYKNDRKATGVVAGMLSIHNWLGTWKNKVDGFIAISDFVKEQLVRGRLPEHKIHVKYNFVNEPPDFSLHWNNEFLYVGRLSVEKGIEQLLSAFLDPRLKHLHLKVIGDGPQKKSVMDATTKNPNITYSGKNSLPQTYHCMMESQALIFPSQWHEPFGRTIVEAFAAGTPVIGAAVGGVTELIVDNFNGFLYNPNSVDELIDKILAMSNYKDYDRLRRNARDSYNDNFTSEINYKKLMEIYSHVLNATEAL